jgi:hypothetical protein
VVVLTVTGALLNAKAPALLPDTVRGEVAPPPYAVNANPPEESVTPLLLATVKVAVVFAPVAETCRDWPLVRARAVVRPEISSVPPDPIELVGLTTEPEPLKAKVPPEIVVFPV